MTKKELEKEKDYWKARCHNLADKLRSYVKKTAQIDRLKKENAELKEAIKHFNPCGDWNDDVHDCEFMHYAIKYGSQLTKATKIIKRLMHELVVSNRPYNEVELLVKDAEQFLKE